MGSAVGVVADEVVELATDADEEEAIDSVREGVSAMMVADCCQCCCQ